MRNRTARLGARVSAAVLSGCVACGHPFTLHRNGTTSCKAAACTAGPGGAPCQGFVQQEHAAHLERLAS